MFSTRKSLGIKAPANLLMSIILDFPTYSDWVSGVKTVKVLKSSASGRNMVVNFKADHYLLKDTYTLSYEWSHAGTVIDWKLASPSRVQKVNEGSLKLGLIDSETTMVNYELSLIPKIPIVSPLRRKIEELVVDRYLADLLKRVQMLEGK